VPPLHQPARKETHNCLPTMRGQASRANARMCHRLTARFDVLPRTPRRGRRLCACIEFAQRRLAKEAANRVAEVDAVAKPVPRKESCPGSSRTRSRAARISFAKRHRQMLLSVAGARIPADRESASGYAHPLRYSVAIRSTPRLVSEQAQPNGRLSRGAHLRPTERIGLRVRLARSSGHRGEQQ
jgi:hypothetical protein